MSEVNNNQAQDLSELLQIRRDKLADLQRRGKDPFKITKYDVSHHSEEVKKAVAELEGKTVSVAGRMEEFLRLENNSGSGRYSSKRFRLSS